MPEPNEDGTDGPFRSIARAQHAVRTVNKNMTDDVVVAIREGTYSLTETLQFDERDSGSNGFSVIYRAYADEKPVLSGGYRVTGWQAVDGKPYYKAVLPAGIADTRQFYVNGKRKVRARTEFQITGKQAYKAPLSPYDHDGYVIDGALLPGAFANPGDMQLHVNATWRDFWVPIAGIAEDAAGDKVVTFKQPAYNEMIGMEPREQTPTFNRLFYVENALELLDRHGEWYFNQSTREIFYYPQDHEDVGSMEAVVPVLERLLQVRGSSLSNKVRYLRFEGLVFEHAGWSRPNQEGFATVQAEWITKPSVTALEELEMTVPAAVHLHAAEHIVIKGNTFRHLGAAGLGLFFGVNESTVEGNVFYDISDAAVTVGTQRGALIDRPWEETPKNNIVSNNVIRNIGVEYWSAPAIGSYFQDNITIAHNDIADVPYSGIVGGHWSGLDQPAGGRGMKVRNNKVKNHNLRSYDGGGFYYFGPSADSIVEGNYFARDENVYAYGPGEIYLDDTTTGFTVRNNVVENPVHYWLFLWIHTVRDNIVTHNYTSSPEMLNAGTNNTVEDNTVVQGGNWPQAALDIMSAAGLEPQYESLLGEVPVISNTAPTVALGEDQTISIAESAKLEPLIAGDDDAPQQLTTFKWSKVSGPGTVTFSTGGLPSTKAYFSVPGTYVLQLTASDGYLTASDTIGITVTEDDSLVNVALGRPATASSSYTQEPGFPNKYLPDRAVDGDPLSGWAPNWEKAWYRLDLQGAYRINRIELVSRQDSPEYDFDDSRRNFAVEASNDPDFETYTVLGSQGTTPFEPGTWSLNVADPVTYRYIRVSKTAAGSFYMAELRVFGEEVVSPQDADLVWLKVNPGSLSPVFHRDTVDYEVTVPNEIEAIVVTPAASNPEASVQVKGQPVESGTPSEPNPLQVGDNTIPVTVRSADGTVTKTYTLHVRRTGELSSRADEFNDFGQMESHTADMKVESGSGDGFEGDTRTLMLSGETQLPQSIVYRQEALSDFSLRLYFHRAFITEPAALVSFHVSPDGKTWSRVPAAVGSSNDTAGGWAGVTLASDGNLPRGTQYLKVGLSNAIHPYWAIQLSKLTLSYESIEPGFVMTDELSDWSRSHAHTGMLTIEASDGSGFGGDIRTVRIDPGAAEPQRVTYYRPGSKAIAAKVFYHKSFVADPLGLVGFEASANGTDWTAVPAAAGASVDTGGGWAAVDVESADRLPEGTVYVRLKLSHTTDPFWALQVGRVAIGYEPSGGKAITGFTVPVQTGETAIDVVARTITVRVPFGTDVSALAPAISLSELASVSPAGGAPIDFTAPRIFTVTAEDGTKQDWMVAVIVDPDRAAPEAPASLQVSELDKDRLTLAWEASRDNDAVARYVLTMNGDLLAVVEPDNLTYTVLTVDKKTTYAFVVYAEDAAGNRSAGASLEVTTPSGSGNGQLKIKDKTEEQGGEDRLAK